MSVFVAQIFHMWIKNLTLVNLFQSLYQLDIWTSMIWILFLPPVFYLLCLFWSIAALFTIVHVYSVWKFKMVSLLTLNVCLLRNIINFGRGPIAGIEALGYGLRMRFSSQKLVMRYFLFKFCSWMLKLVCKMG